MKPTPAQIEAAARIMAEHFPGTYFESFMIISERALTAAAEVGEQHPINVYNTVYQKAIERCARVAERYIQNPQFREIAAAIRKLKDE